LLLKVAARCNLDCAYCYWFRDRTVYDKPKTLSRESERMLLVRLEEHIRQFELDGFSVLLHGGEPLLFGKERFVGLMDGLEGVATRTGCAIDRGITTNATLIDEEWARLLRIFSCHVTVSLDGPGDVHDENRFDFNGNGSYERVRKGIDMLRSQGIEPAVLAVCLPKQNPETICAHFVDELGLRYFDILLPDATHDDGPTAPIAAYYTKLFDLWYDRYAERGVTVRTIDAITRALLGGRSGCEAIGYGPINLLTVTTDGCLEPLDVLRIAGQGSTRTGVSVHTHTLQEAVSDPVWLEAYDASLNLAAECKTCEFRSACGGGYLPHRYSSARRYDNPSVYCSDLKQIFAHAWGRIAADIDVVTPAGTLRLCDAVVGLDPPQAQPMSARIPSANRNQLSGLRSFMQRWDCPSSSGAHAVEHRAGIGDQINLEGDAACVKATSYTRCERPFEYAIESGVRILVDHLIEHFNCITYSSCAGHRATLTSPQRVRHVGIVPRNDEEFERLRAILQECADIVNVTAPTDVRVRIAREMLTDGGLCMPVLDVFFEPTGKASAESYFSQVDAPYLQFVQALESFSGGTSETPCCP
jgi:uncharacterized protein